MTTYTLNGTVLREDGDGTVLGVNDTTFEFVVPDQVTSINTFVDGINNDGEPILDIILADNDSRLAGNSLYDEATGDERDLGFVSIDWSFGGGTGTSIVVNIYDNATDDSYIFAVGGDPLPGSAFASPASAEAFIASSTIGVPAPSSGFFPGVPIAFPTLPGVVITQNDRASDNRNEETPDRAYDFGIGDDTFDAGVGNDTIDGGAGSDIVHYEFIQGGIRANLSDSARDGIAAGTVQKSSGTDSIENVENLLATNTSDVVFLSDAAGFIFDRAGNDRIEGGAGDTRFLVGSGNDTLTGGGGQNRLIFEDDGFDGAGDITQGVTVTMSGAGEGSATDSWGGNDIFEDITDRIVGTHLDDTFFGGSGDDRFEGGAGDDQFVNLGGGSDRFDGDEGRDELVTDVTMLEVGDLSVDLGAGTHGRTDSDVGQDRLNDIEDFTLLGDWNVQGAGTDGDNLFQTGGGADQVAGRGGNDMLITGAGNDVLAGGAGDDTLDGGTGADRMDGGTGDDTYRIDNARDRVIEVSGGGADAILATAEVTLGGAEIEVVTLEGTGNLQLNGNGFATTITGNSGSNILIGGGGDDTVTGGGGSDFFVFQASDEGGPARITDFTRGQDRLAIDDQLFGLGDGSIDPRDVTDQQVENALEFRAFNYRASTGELFVDADGRGGPADPILIAVIEGGGPLTQDDVLLF